MIPELMCYVKKVIWHEKGEGRSQKTKIRYDIKIQPFSLALFVENSIRFVIHVMGLIFTLESSFIP